MGRKTKKKKGGRKERKGDKRPQTRMLKEKLKNRGQEKTDWNFKWTNLF